MSCFRIKCWPYMHLFDMRSPTLLSGYDSQLSDLDGAGPCLMTTCHVTVCTTNRDSIVCSYTLHMHADLQQRVMAPATVKSRYSRYML